MGVEESGLRGDGFRRWLQEEVKRRKQQKRPNAEKHGVFSADLTMPGEDPRDKRRAQYFLQCKLKAIKRSPEHHAFDEEAGLPLFIEWMRADPEALLRDIQGSSLAIRSTS
jgi:hypothetical protein